VEAEPEARVIPRSADDPWLPDQADTPPSWTRVQAAEPPAPVSLHAAIARADYGTALRMIEEGADINGKDSGAGATPLHYAAMRGKMPIIELLIARGADVNAPSRTGATPLHTAVAYSKSEAAEFLLRNGARIDAASQSGATPLAVAEAARNQSLAELLRRYGAR
jgi:ankyrin repeat protein